MPITFIDIERQKSWRIFAFFLVLIALYFILAFVIAISFYKLFSAGLFPVRDFFSKPSVLIVISVSSLLIALMHFCLSALNAVNHIRQNLGALDPDKEDEIHKQLMNIVEEINIASGRKVRIRCLVIPSLSVNALSAVDLRGNAIIAITEGLLSRTSRSQLEAVVAHEACHILSGDCLETTIASSLFGVPSAALDKIGAESEGRVFFSPVFVLTWMLVTAGTLLNLFISREREYRADAGAVRMTRNPLALAEILYMLSRRWKGSGSIGAGLEMLCIINTSDSNLDESEGWLADLMSTHPPVSKRIRILLRMAHSDLSLLKKEMDSVDSVAPSCEKTDTSLYALDSKYQWQGPIPLPDLAALPWLTADTWIANNRDMVKASQIPDITALLRERVDRDAQAVSTFNCPSCGQPLIESIYEKTKIYRCRFCGGSLVDDVRLTRIIVRKDTKYSARLRALSETTLSENQRIMTARRKNKNAAVNTGLLNCPKCGNRMNRTFYSMAYMVELDRCSYCGVNWFDNDELEMLQCMIDNKMASASFPDAERIEYPVKDVVGSGSAGNFPDST